MRTYLLHVAGRTIGRESGLQPMPVQADDIADRAALEAVMLATVRRCLPLTGDDFIVRWTSRRRASVYTGTALCGVLVARFRIADVTEADHRLGGVLPATPGSGMAR